MTRIAIITGSTRPGRKADAVARLVAGELKLADVRSQVPLTLRSDLRDGAGDHQPAPARRRPHHARRGRCVERRTQRTARRNPRPCLRRVTGVARGRPDRYRHTLIPHISVDRAWEALAFHAQASAVREILAVIGDNGVGKSSLVVRPAGSTDGGGCARG